MFQSTTGFFNLPSWIIYFCGHSWPNIRWYSSIIPLSSYFILIRTSNCAGNVTVPKILSKVLRWTVHYLRIEYISGWGMNLIYFLGPFIIYFLQKEWILNTTTCGDKSIFCPHGVQSVVKCSIRELWWLKVPVTGHSMSWRDRWLSFATRSVFV